MIRKKRLYTVITFATTTTAMAMEKKCGEDKIPGRLIPVPREITAGCGLAWRMTVDDYENYNEQIKQLGIKFQELVQLEL